MIKKLLILFAVAVSISANAQRDTVLKSRLELGMNLSQLLSTATGNKTGSILDLPYTFVVKWRTKNPSGAFRFGGGSDIKHKEDNSSGQTFRVTDEREFTPFVGYEWRRSLGKGFVFIGGVDVRYIYLDEKTVNTDFTTGGLTTIKGTQKGLGGGPFYGMMWNMNKHLSLYTEGYFYGNWVHHKRTLNAWGVTNEIENNVLFTFLPVVPVSVFLLVKF